MKLSKEELQMLISIVESVSIKGTEGMKAVLSLSEKLKKGLEEKKE